MSKTIRRQPPVILTDAEAAALLAQCKTHITTGLRNRAMLEAMPGAGLRLSEALDLWPDDVDLRKRTVYVCRVSAKGGHERVVPIDRETVRWLRLWTERREAVELEDAEAFFCRWAGNARGSALRPRYVQEMVKRLAARAGIEKIVTPKVLRNTYAVRLLRKGLSLHEVRDRLGLARTETARSYTLPLPALSSEEPTVTRLLTRLTPARKAALREALRANA